MALALSTVALLAMMPSMAGSADAGATPSLTDHVSRTGIEPRKAAAATTSIPPDPVHLHQGGDTIATATVIPGLPYSATGTTEGYTNDYTSCSGCFSCPYIAGSARDVVYRYTPSVRMHIGIDLCLSSWDTVLYVLEDVAGNVIACNDDACGLQSRLERVALDPGHTYYIVVDGYDAPAFGTYHLEMWELLCGASPCPPNGVVEGEPPCHDDYEDRYNGGCNSTPPVFTSLPCSAPDSSTTVCGTYGGFRFGGISYRDTDWYEIVLERPSTITWEVFCLTDTLLGIIDGNVGCPVTNFYDYALGAFCELASITATLPSGRWWLYVATQGFGPSAGACPFPYAATLSGYECGPTSVEAATWGRIKGMYRETDGTRSP